MDSQDDDVGLLEVMTKQLIAVDEANKEKDDDVDIKSNLNEDNDGDGMKLDGGNEENGEQDDDGGEDGGENRVTFAEDDNNDDNDEDDPDPDPAIVGLSRPPSYKKANSVNFRQLCTALEALDTLKGNKFNKRTIREKLEILLPAKLLASIAPGSPYPIIRLLVPDRDTARQCLTKQRSIAEAYSDALELNKNSPKWVALRKYTDPKLLSAVNKEWYGLAGDLSLVVEAVMKERTVASEKSKLTVGKINTLLDELGRSLKGKDGVFNSTNTQNWRGASQSQSFTLSNTQGPKNKNRVSNRRVREAFVRDLIDRYKITPMEHKWICRLLLEDIKIGLGFERIINWFSADAEDFYKVHNSLKATCDKLSDPDYVEQRHREIKRNEEAQKRERFVRLFNYNSTHEPVRIGNSMSAMRSDRTGFDSCLAEIATKHREVLSNKKDLPKDDPVRESLALKFPAFMAEVKLDGERMVVHVNRGVVTMHTRQSKWYSRLYSPVLGPAVRKSLKYDIDVILDGEILSWDDGEKKLIEFGNNRTVAKLRKDWLRACDPDKLDPRDEGLHDDEKEAKVMRPEYHARYDKGHGDIDGGDQVWLKFTAFDVLYVGGPGAKECLEKGLGQWGSDNEEGSVAHLSLFERKALLHHLMEEQENVCDIVESIVVRPNGDWQTSREYFSVEAGATKEQGYPKWVIDSAKWTLNTGKWSPQLDAKQRKLHGDNRNDTVISHRRTDIVDQYYNEIVENRGLEGLVIKDLASPYIFRSKTSKYRAWLKIKPDYSSRSFASDIDVVVIGGTWAMGHRRSGQLSSFLCGCVDSKTPGKYFTFCRINAKSLRDQELNGLLEHTGFKPARGDNEISYGKWFKEEEHGKTLPNFISERSFQPNPKGDGYAKGWQFSSAKDFYPDLWIRPDDSIILTVNASEIVGSDEYSAGLTLRFPRATRGRNTDDKGAHECIDEEELEKLRSEYLEKQKSSRARITSANGVNISSPSKSKSKAAGTFWTAERYLQTKKKKKTTSRKVERRVRIVTGDAIDDCLDGLKFFVFQGQYRLEPFGPDAELAHQEGWFDWAKDVQSDDDITSFIYSHGGTLVNAQALDVYSIAGADDMKVQMAIKGYDKLKEKNLKALKAAAKKAAKADPNEAAEPENRVADIGVPGILKWTHVYSLVARWSKGLQDWKDNRKDEGPSPDQEEEDAYDQTLRQQLAKPRFFDFVAQSSVYGTDPNELIWRHGALDSAMMERALSCMDTSTQPPKRKKARVEQSAAPWHQAAMQNLAAGDRWVLKCQHEKLWPYEQNDEGARPKGLVVVYPDFFGDDFGLPKVETYYVEDNKRRKQASRDMKDSSVGSSLPLLRAMGAVVSWNLHRGVTHILCDLADGIESVSWSPGQESIQGMKDAQHETNLLARLEATMAGSVLFITRDWVDAQWNN